MKKLSSGFLLTALSIWRKSKSLGSIWITLLVSQFFNVKLNRFNIKAVYKSPQYEKLGYDLIIDQLIKQGYPSKLANYSFDSSFVVRGLLFDRKMGNLLKIDGFGNILVAWHGFSPLNYDKLRDSYPNKFINKVTKASLGQFNRFKEDSERFFVYNTLFNLPEIYVMAVMIDMYQKLEEYDCTEKGFKHREEQIEITYNLIFNDVREVRTIHLIFAL